MKFLSNVMLVFVFGFLVSCADEVSENTSTTSTKGLTLQVDTKSQITAPSASIISDKKRFREQQEALSAAQAKAVVKAEAEAVAKRKAEAKRKAKAAAKAEKEAIQREAQHNRKQI